MMFPSQLGGSSLSAAAYQRLASCPVADPPCADQKVQCSLSCLVCSWGLHHWVEMNLCVLLICSSCACLSTDHALPLPTLSCTADVRGFWLPWTGACAQHPRHHPHLS